MRITFIKILTIAVLFTSPLLAQNGDKQQWEAVKNMFYQFKNMKQYGYTYTLAATFPDGTTDQLKGEIFVNTDNKMMLADSKVSTILLEDGWYLNADHKRKTVVIVNTNKTGRKKMKQQADAFFFGNGDYISAFIDSAILKKGIIRSFQRSGDTIHCSIGFPPRLEIKSMQLVFDDAHKMPVRYEVKLYYPWPGNDKRFKGKGTTKVVTCNYNPNPDKNKYDIRNYFAVVNGKAILKKYQTYILKTDL